MDISAAALAPREKSWLRQKQLITGVRGYVGSLRDPHYASLLLPPVTQPGLADRALGEHVA